MSRTKINRNMVEGRRRFLSVFADIEEGRRCEQLSGALSALADGEISRGDHSGLNEHLHQCAHCRAKLREYRAVPQRVLALSPVVALAGTSLFERAGDRALAAADRARDIAASVLHRGGGVDASQAVAAGGGTRGSGLALIGVVCGLGAAGGGAAVCVDQGVIPDPFKPTTEIQLPAAQTLPTETVQTTAPPAEQVPTPTQQRQNEFGIEKGSAKSGSSTEFGGPAGGGGSSGSSGGGSVGGSFGFEK